MVQNLILAAAFIFSLIVSLPRLSAGLPMGVDSSSHLSKVMFVTDSLMRYGTIPFWNPDWYGGTPFLVLYPPLSYVLTGFLGVAVGPVLAYKLVDLVFYVAAVPVVYWLARDFGLSGLESAVAVFLYGTVPEVVENYVFYDRLPTTISIVLVCLFLISLRRVLQSKSPRWVLLPSVTLAAVMLTHHLSGLIAVLIGCILISATFPNRISTSHHLGVGLGAIAGGIGLSAIWIIPYSVALTQLPPNGFFNRNVMFSFLRFTYFGIDIASALLGIAQFILAVVGFQVLVRRAYRGAFRLQPIHLILLLLGGMGFYQFSELAGLPMLMPVGIVVIIVAFLAFLVEISRRSIRGGLMTRAETLGFVCLWFVLFFWVGLGYYALPIFWFYPMKKLWISLDVYRFWLYFAIPMVMLAGVGLLRAVRSLSMKGKYWAILLIVIVAVPVFLSPALRIRYSDTQPVNPHLPYSTANADVPPEILRYFDGDKSEGRILAIKCPLWVYLLPRIVDKPTVDGWYPQSKLLNRLIGDDLDDYRIDDLESAPSQDVRIRTWRNLINSSDVLGIEWIMIGDLSNAEKQTLLGNSGFTEVLSIPYSPSSISIYKTTHDVELVDVFPPGAFQVTMERVSPDHIRLTLTGASDKAEIQIREAWFPTWVASADGKSIRIVRNSEGYIQLTAEQWMKTIDITHQTDPTVSGIGWIVVFATLTCLLVGTVIGRSKDDETRQ
jgi:hypothetical protein